MGLTDSVDEKTLSSLHSSELEPISTNFMQETSAIESADSSDQGNRSKSVQSKEEISGPWNDINLNEYSYDNSVKDRESLIKKWHIEQTKQYYAQKKIYVDKIQTNVFHNLNDQCITKVINLSLDSGDEYTSSTDKSSELDDELPFFPSLHPHDIPLDQNLSKSDVIERLEWQSMLTTVLNGEVVKSERKRLSRATDCNDLKMQQNMIWLGLRAALSGKTIEQIEHRHNMLRTEIDLILNDLLDFKVKGRRETTMSPREQVDEILLKISNCEDLYPSRAILMKNHPKYNSPKLQHKLNALISWKYVTENIQMSKKILSTWIGYEEFYLFCDSDSHDNSIEEKTSLIESMIKKNGLQETFGRNLFKSLHTLISRVKATTIEYAEDYENVHLPTYLDDMLILLIFPTRLIEQVLKLKLSSARKLENPTILKIDRIIEDLQNSLCYAVQFKKDYLELSKPEKGWNLPPCLDESYDKTINDSLKFYMSILYVKICGENRNVNFRESEILEQEWGFLEKIVSMFPGAEILRAKHFCIILLMIFTQCYNNVRSYYKGSTSIQGENQFNIFFNMFEKIRLRLRKLSRFYKKKLEAYDNAAEYSVPDDRLDQLVDKLAQNGFILIDSKKKPKEHIIVLTHPSFTKSESTMESLINDGLADLNLVEDVQNKSYVLLLHPKKYITWKGEIEYMNFDYSKCSLRQGRLRLITMGDFHNLNAEFRLIAEDGVILVVERRASNLKLHFEVQKMKKMISGINFQLLACIDALRKNSTPSDVEMIQNVYSQIIEHCLRTLRLSPMDFQGKINLSKKLMQASIDWLAFVCDECNPTEKRTFRWAVNALDNVVIVFSGLDILMLTSARFNMMREKVARCMTLLISHFDVMGARSNKAANEEIKASKLNCIDDNMRLLCELRNSIYDFLKDEEKFLQPIRALDQQLVEKHEKSHNMGRVIDDSLVENQLLTNLASSLSNITMRWQQGKYIGGGTFGRVYEAFNIDTGDLIAVKEIRVYDTLSLPTIVKSIKDEMTVLEILDHPNVVQYYGIEVHRDKVYIFMEYCKGGSLAKLLESGRIEDEMIIQVYALQLLEGLAYLHERGIAHRDIKPQNILLDHNGIIKYSDFGTSKVIQQQTEFGRSKTKVNGITGTPMYMAPEMITGKFKGHQGIMDVWSLGCCIVELASGMHPWHNYDNEWAIMYQIAAGETPSLPTKDQVSAEALNFLRRCFITDPANRPTAEELLFDPWIMSIRKETGVIGPLDDKA